jgi:hypothetical protein
VGGCFHDPVFGFRKTPGPAVLERPGHFASPVKCGDLGIFESAAWIWPLTWAATL